MAATGDLTWMEDWVSIGAEASGPCVIDVRGERFTTALSFGAYVLVRRPPPRGAAVLSDSAARELRNAFTAPLPRSEEVELDELKGWLGPVEWGEDLEGELWRPQRPGWFYGVLIDRNLAAWALAPFHDPTITVGVFDVAGRTTSGQCTSKAFAFEAHGWRLVVLSLRETLTLERMSRVERAAIPRWSEAP